MPIIVSFTTSPRRLPLCEPMVASLADQTRKPDAIVLNLPPRFDRTGEEYPPDSLLPGWLTDTVEIHRCDRDWGPATKLVPTVLRQQAGRRALIITVDDDIRYPPTVISALAEVADNDDGEVWCVSGFNIVKAQLTRGVPHGRRCAVAEGYAGVAYPTSAFGPDFGDYIQGAIADTDLRLHDDVMISNYLAEHDVPRRILDSPTYSWTMFWQSNAVLDYGFYDDALNRLHGHETNLSRLPRIIAKLGEGAKLCQRP